MEKLTATISINKILTIVENNNVYTAKIKEFSRIISKYSEVTINGLMNESKKNKYESILLLNGFTIKETLYDNNAGFDGKYSNVNNYAIIYKK